VRRCAEHGFTLVELMVVVVVIGLTATVAMWAMPDPRGRVTDEAARFATRVKAARDLAIVGARPVSLWATTGGYGFDRREDGRWVPMADKPLRVERWSAGTAARLDDRSGRMRVTFDTTGLADHPAELLLQRGTAQARIAIAGDGSARIGG
jgi:general secretion pathway protein H